MMNSPSDQSVDLFLSFDEETGFYRRHVFQYEINRRLDQAKSESGRFLLFEVGFEEDRIITEQSDTVLRDLMISSVSKTLASLAEADWMLCRFAQHRLVLCSPLIGIDQTEENLSDQLISALQNAAVTGQVDLPIPVCVGSVRYPEDADTSTELVERAHLAMLFSLDQLDLSAQSVASAKYQPSMGEAASRLQALGRELESVIERDELKVLIQPEIQFQNRQLVGLSFFPVWEHPQWGFVDTAELYRLARTQCLSARLAECVVRQALLELQKISGQQRLKYRINLHLPSDLLKHNSNIEALIDLVESQGGAPADLMLSFQEKGLQTSSNLVRQCLQRLSEKGFKVGLEGFGQGQASLHALRRLPVSQIVMAPVVVDHIVSNMDDFYLANAIVSMAQSLKIRVVADGVRNAAQVSILNRMNCHFGRGEFFAEPMSTDQFPDWFQHTLPVLTQQASEEQFEKRPTLLLVDDEPAILSALRRLLRADGYSIFCAGSANEAFDILAVESVDVILSDQRMPEMNGTEFLSVVKERYPQTVRLVLSGYTDLQSVTEAINKGAIYKFLTKPWDDEQLRANLREAFQRFDIEQQNHRLKQEVEQVNEELMRLNHVLELKINARNERIERDDDFRRVMQEMFNHLPVAVIGLDLSGDIVAVNSAASGLLGLPTVHLLNADFASLPSPLSEFLRHFFFDAEDDSVCERIRLNNRDIDVTIQAMGEHSKSNGYLLVLTPCQEVCV